MTLFRNQLCHEWLGSIRCGAPLPMGTVTVLFSDTRMAFLQTAQLAHFRLPAIENEAPKTFAPNSAERKQLAEALKHVKANAPYIVPCFVNGVKVETGNFDEQRNPSDHNTVLAKYHQADSTLIDKAIRGALAAKTKWEAMPFSDRATIFLKAADLLANKYRYVIALGYKVLAATMLGQGKNAWQAEIDACDELVDFWRFNAKYAEELYSQQPPKNSPGVWNRVEYRAL
ncbi:Aldehyde/histidinol dehydrogenase, partial [Jimgerdemannia flammicorona]